MFLPPLFRKCLILFAKNENSVTVEVPALDLLCVNFDNSIYTFTNKSINYSSSKVGTFKLRKSNNYIN